MNSVLDGSKVQTGTKPRGKGAATAYVQDAKEAIFEKLEDSRIAAERLLKRSRYAVEDGLEVAAHTIKQHPFRTLAIGFAAGAALGFLVPRLGKK
jgi:ElaB/YqjD/DUF883 family membrane-anchored ribosome-binding protein